MILKMQFSLESDELKQVQTYLHLLPKKLRNGAMRNGGRKAAQIVKKKIQPLVPRSKNKQKGYVHLRQGIVSRVRTYGNTIFAIVGPRSGAKLFHAHLIEFGTRPRFTRHTSRYKVVGTRSVRAKRRTAAGGTSRYYIRKKVRRSVGSFADPNKLKKGPVHSTGVGPAYQYMSRGWQASKILMEKTLADEIRLALAKKGVRT